MTFQFINSNFENSGVIKDLLVGGLETSMNIDWAVAFGKHTAFKSMDGSFSDFFKKGGKSRAIFDLSSGITDPSLIEELLTYPGESFCRVFCGVSNRSGIFHPKFYIFRNEEDVKVLLGSANFSNNAFHRNFESCIYSEGTVTDSFFQEITESFEQDFWNSHLLVSPEADTDILKIYSDLFSQRKKSKEKRAKTAAKLEKLLNELAQHQLKQEHVGIENSYLAGLICASAYNLKIDDIQNRILTLKFKSAVANNNTVDEGYICANIDGEILGGIRLPQRKTQSATLRRIYGDLKSFVKWDNKKNDIQIDDLSKIRTIFSISIRFVKDSNLWNVVEGILKQFRVENNKLHPMIPQEIIEAKDRNIQKHFLRGYFDFRSRVSKSDKYPGQFGRLRVAVQVGTNDIPFLEQIDQVLQEHGIETEPSYGEHRSKDNMIRIIPNKELLNFWSAGYHKILINSFIEYNNNL